MVPFVLMKAGYHLSIQNPDDLDVPYIFRIKDESNTPVFDVYIHTNSDALNLNMNEVMDENR